MRVIYANARYANDSSTGGAAHMRQFIENASALGHELFLWHGLQQHPLTKPVPQGSLARLKLFRTADVMYYRIEWEPPMGPRVILPPWRTLAGDPMVVWEFNTVPEFGRVLGVDESVLQWALAELKRLAAGVDLAVCVSDAIAQYVRANFGIANVITVPNGSDPDLFKPGLPPVPHFEKRPDRMDVVWIGSASLAWHHFDLLRDAAWEIHKAGEGQRIAFHVIGQGMTGLRDAPPNVNYYGPEEYRKLPNWLSSMDVGLNVYRAGPADYSSPLKVFDYMASGLAVVSTEQPQVREIFRELGQEELMIPSDQPAALAGALRRLAGDGDYRRRLGAAGRARVIDRYNWKRAVADTFAAVEKIRSR